MYLCESVRACVYVCVCVCECVCVRCVCVGTIHVIVIVMARCLRLLGSFYTMVVSTIGMLIRDDEQLERT